MVAIPFIGPTYQSRVKALDLQRRVNLYFEEDEGRGGKSAGVLLGTPGLVLKYDVQSTGGIRALYTARRSNRVFAVADNRFIELHPDFTYTDRGTLNTLTQPVSIADSALEVKITDGADGYIFTLATDTFAQISDPDYLGGGACTQQDSYFVVLTPDSEQFQVSSLNDGLSYAAADVSSADTQPDTLVGIATDESRLWLFGQRGTEVHYNSGNVDFPFEPLQGVVFDVGAVNFAVIAAFEGTMVWLGRGRTGGARVYASTGLQPPQPLSTHAIDFLLGQWSDLARCRSYVYTDEGHTFYILWHPDGTVAFDFKTGMWHERAAMNATTGLLETHRVCCHTFGHGLHLGGDYAQGYVYAMDLDTYTDNGALMPAINAGEYIHSGRQRVRHNRFEIEMERGVGLGGVLSTASGYDPIAELRWTDDHGGGWTDYRPLRMGRIGETRVRVKAERLGATRARVYEVRITAPVKRAIIGAYLNE